MLVFNKHHNNLMTRGVKPMKTKHEEFNPD